MAGATVSLEKVQSAVREAAQREASLVLQKARKATELRVAQAAETARAEAELEFERQTRQLQEELAQQLLQAQSEARKVVLAKQNDCLNRVFARARQRFLEWPTEIAGPVLLRLLQSAAGNACGAVCVHPADHRLIDHVLEQFNQGRAEDARVALAAQPLAKRGGFVFAAGAYEVDYTLDTLLETLRREAGPKVAADMFREDAGGAA